MSKITGIYRIKNTINGMYYIGSSVNVKRRWNRHVHHLRIGDHPNPKLQAAWLKYHEHAFIIEVVEHVSDPTDLLVREQHYLDALKPHYNCLEIASSRLGCKQSEAFKEKMRNRAKYFRSATHKECSKCRIVKSRSEFDRQHVPGKDANRHKCKSCLKEYNRARYIRITGRTERLPCGGDVMSPEAKLRMSIERTGKKQPPRSDSYREKIRQSKLGKKRPPLSAEWRAKISAGVKRARPALTLEHRKRISEAHKSLHARNRANQNT